MTYCALCTVLHAGAQEQVLCAIVVRSPVLDAGECEKLVRTISEAYEPGSTVDILPLREEGRARFEPLGGMIFGAPSAAAGRGEIRAESPRFAILRRIRSLFS